MAESFDLATAAALLELQSDGVILTRGRTIAFMNQAAGEQLGCDFTGVQAAKALPPCLVNLQSHCCAAAVTVGERFLTMTVRTVGLYRLYTLRQPPEAKLVQSPGRELWTHLMNLRMLTQQLDSGSAEGKELQARFMRLYYQLHRRLTNAATLAGLDDGTLPFLPAVADCASALRAIEAPLRRLAEGRGIALELDLPEEPVSAMADVELMNRALLNLVLNSMLQCSAGDRLRFRLHGSDDTVTITLQDSGPGISPERIQNLFWRSERGGLAVVQGVMRLHGGGLLVESNPGGGATARVLLPRLTDPAALHSAASARTIDVTKALLTGLADVLTAEQILQLNDDANFV